MGYRFFTVNATPSLGAFLHAPTREALRVVYHKKTPEHLLPGLHEVVVKVRVPIAIADRDGVEREQFRQILRNFFGRIVKVAKVQRPPWPLPWTLEMMDSSEQLQQLLEFHVQECLGAAATKRGTSAGDARPAKRRGREGMPMEMPPPPYQQHAGMVDWPNPHTLAANPAFLRLRERGNSPRSAAITSSSGPDTSAMRSLAALAALARGPFTRAEEPRKAVDASTSSMWPDPTLYMPPHATPSSSSSTSSSSRTSATSLEPVAARTVGGWAFFVIRTEPRWPLPLEKGAGVPKLDITYTGLTNPETILASDVMMAIGVQPMRDLSYIVNVVRNLETGLTMAVADAIATRCRTPYATEFPLIVRGDCAYLEDLKNQLVNGLRACLQSAEQKYPPLGVPKPTARGPVVLRRDPARPSPYFKITDGGRLVNGPYGLGVVEGQNQGFILMLDSVLHSPGRGDLVPLGSMSKDVRESMQVALSFWKLHADYLLKCFGQKANPHDQDVDVTVLLQNAVLRAGGGELGLAIAVHLATLFTPRKTFENLAVTGAISLSGAISPVFGLRPKIEAAYRDGVTNLALPSRNITHEGDMSNPEVKIVDIESKADDITSRFIGSSSAAAAAAAATNSTSSKEVPVNLTVQVYDSMKFFAANTVFDCLHLALQGDKSNGAATATEQQQPPPLPLSSPRELRVAKSMEWGYLTGSVQNVEVAVLPYGRGRCHLTGNLSESSAMAVQAAVEALHGQHKCVAARCAATGGSLWFSLPLTRQDLHIHLPGLKEKEGRDIGMGAMVALLAVMLQEQVPEDAAFVGEVNVGGFFYQCREMDGLQLDIARRGGIKRLFVPKMTVENMYMKERLPADFRSGERQVVGVATLLELMQVLWPRHERPRMT